jgi:hypothetical protein
MNETFMPIVMSAIAFWSRSRDTIEGMMAWRTGWPTAVVTPTPAASA